MTHYGTSHLIQRNHIFPENFISIRTLNSSQLLFVNITMGTYWAIKLHYTFTHFTSRTLRNYRKLTSITTFFLIFLAITWRTTTQTALKSLAKEVKQSQGEEVNKITTEGGSGPLPMGSLTLYCIGVDSEVDTWHQQIKEGTRYVLWVLLE